MTVVVAQTQLGQECCRSERSTHCHNDSRLNLLAALSRALQNKKPTKSRDISQPYCSGNRNIPHCPARKRNVARLVSFRLIKHNRFTTTVISKYCTHLPTSKSMLAGLAWSCGRLHSPPRLKRYSPGPGDYNPQADRNGKISFTGAARGSFPSASRYEGSYLDAFARTIHSPGPIYYPNNNTCCSICSGGSSSNHTERPSSGGSTAGVYSTLRAAHSAAGTWNRADVGSRGAILVHCCGCTSPTVNDSSNKQLHCHRHPTEPCSSCAPPADPGGSNAEGGVDGGADTCTRCIACTAAAWSLPGPGSYDVEVGRTGKGLLLTQSCPAFTVPKARKSVSGRHTPFISASHAQHENQGRCSPGPVYNPNISCSRPSSSSPTMQNRGINHWELICSSGRASSARQVLGPSPISRTSKHLLGDAPRTHFGTASLDCWPYISPHHSAVLNKFKAGAEAKYNARYSQLDAHVPTACLVSGPVDRFDDKWLLGAGRLQ